MHGIGAGFGLSADYSGRRCSKLRVKSSRGHFRLGDRFQCRINNDPTQHGIMVVGSVQQVGNASEALTVHEQSIRPLWILRLGRRQADGPQRHARGH